MTDDEERQERIRLQQQIAYTMKKRIVECERRKCQEKTTKVNFALPCVFCGEPERLYPHRFGGEGQWQLECQNCGATGPMAEERHIAVQKWNERLIR